MRGGGVDLGGGGGGGGGQREAEGDQEGKLCWQNSHTFLPQPPNILQRYIICVIFAALVRLW